MDGDANLKLEEGSAEQLQSGDSSRHKDPLIGTTIDGRFFIEEILGSGGMSVVYKAKQLRVNRYVAIKTLIMRLDTKPVYRERFQREIQSLCALNHPHIVTVYDCLIGDDDHPYVIMDFLRGRSLEALIEDDGPLTIDRFARIAVQVCSALEHAHRNGIIHRDLKPGNVVLLDEDTDFVKVVDFGLAKIGEDSRKLTKSGELWGSPPYMSPEQCMGKEADPRSDIYSLGAVMYEMLTGKDPYHEAVTVFELIQHHVGTPPPACSTTNPSVSVPAQVEAVIFKALAKDPVDRYQTAGELRNALVKACTSSVEDSGDFLLRMPGGDQASHSSQDSGQYSNHNQDLAGADYFKFAMNPLGQSQVLPPAAPLPDEASIAAGLLAVVAPAVASDATGQKPALANSAVAPDLRAGTQANNDGSAADLEQLNQLRKPSRQMEYPPAAPSQTPSRLRNLDVPIPSNAVTVPVIIAIFVVAAAGAYFGVAMLGGKQAEKPPAQQTTVPQVTETNKTTKSDGESDTDDSKDAATKTPKRTHARPNVHRRDPEQPKHRPVVKATTTSASAATPKKTTSRPVKDPFDVLINSKDPPKTGRN